jgi:Concanavalin A-like lectin/glucanases superfamily/Fibronectin type III domain
MNTVFKLNSSYGSLNRILIAGFISLLFINQALAGDLNLAWDASASTNVGGYKLYYGTVSKNYTSNIDVGKTTTYKMTGLTNGSKYFFALKAYNTAKSIESSYSNEASATVATTTTTGATWTVCANEYGTCSVSGRREVRFGTSTAFVTGVASGSVLCTSKAFGKDPAIGFAKQCWVSSNTTTAAISVPVTTTTIATASWTVCAKEYQTCAVSGKREVRFGTTTAYITGVASGSVLCTNKAFGKDPAYGLAKQCWVSTNTTTAAISVPVTITATALATTTTTTAVATAPATTTSVNGLVAAYSFDDFGGAMTADASGNGNHGIISEATRTASGYFGNALKFDGTNDWVTVNDSASLDLTTGLTIEAMVNPATVMSSLRTVLMKEQSGDEAYTLLANNASNKPVMAQWIDNGIRILEGVSSLSPNTWWHLAATYDGQYQRLYVNGVKVSERAQTGLIQTSNGAMHIGGNSIWGEYFQGTIDEVRIYNRALSSTEVGTDYKTAVSTSSPTKLILGNNALETKVGTPSPGVASAFKAIPAKKGVVSAIQIYLDGSSTATNLVAGIYEDNGSGHPGKLVVQGSKASPKAGATNTVPIATTTLEAGKTYWIAALGSNGQVNYRYRANTTVPIETCATTGLTSLPTAWSQGSVAPTNGPMSAYVTGY